MDTSHIPLFCLLANILFGGIILSGIARLFHERLKLMHAYCIAICAGGAYF